MRELSGAELAGSTGSVAEAGQANPLYFRHARTSPLRPDRERMGGAQTSTRSGLRVSSVRTAGTTATTSAGKPLELCTRGNHYPAIGALMTTSDDAIRVRVYADYT